MWREDGPIPTIKRDRYPRRLVIFDTEAFRGEVVDGVEVQSFRLGVARYIELSPSLEVIDSQYFTFRSPKAFTGFIDTLTRKDQTLFVYAHNIKYDIQLAGTLTDLIHSGWQVKAFAIDDPPTFIRLQRGRMKILFVDTFNYWQTSVSKMGDQLGLPKLSMPADSDPDEEMIIYCKRDVEVLSEYLLSFMNFLHDNDLAGLGLTLASQAFRSYRHSFMTEEITLHSYPKPTQLERDGYTGGRVEAFHIGTLNDGPYFKLDVNSMYPYVMSSFEYPVQLAGYAEDIPVGQLQKLSESYYVIADVNLSTNTPIYAHRSHHKLIFPIGTYDTVLHHSEALEALSRAHVQAVHRVAIYKTAPIFRSYVDFFYQLKVEATAENNPVMRHQAKILLNSLYGKFGQLDIKTKIIDNPSGMQFGRMSGYSQSLGRRVEVNYLGDKIEIRYKSGEAPYSFPAIAGAVTAYARIYLWQLIEAADPANVYYCDTDSLFTNQQGLDNLQHLLDDSRLGAIKVEDQAEEITIRGAKDYIFGATVKHKGIPHSAVQIAPDQYEYQQFRGAKTWLSQGMPTGVEVYTKVKQRRSIYDKGEVLASGKVIPWSL